MIGAKRGWWCDEVERSEKDEDEDEDHEMGWDCVVFCVRCAVCGVIRLSSSASGTGHDETGGIKITSLSEPPWESRISHHKDLPARNVDSQSSRSANLSLHSLVSSLRPRRFASPEDRNHPKAEDTMSAPDPTSSASTTSPASLLSLLLALPLTHPSVLPLLALQPLSHPSHLPASQLSKYLARINAAVLSRDEAERRTGCGVARELVVQDGEGWVLGGWGRAWAGCSLGVLAVSRTLRLGMESCDFRHGREKSMGVGVGVGGTEEGRRRRSWARH